MDELSEPTPILALPILPQFEDIIYPHIQISSIRSDDNPSSTSSLCSSLLPQFYLHIRMADYVQVRSGRIPRVQYDNDHPPPQATTIALFQQDIINSNYVTKIRNALSSIYHIEDSECQDHVIREVEEVTHREFPEFFSHAVCSIDVAVVEASLTIHRCVPYMPQLEQYQELAEDEEDDNLIEVPVLERVPEIYVRIMLEEKKNDNCAICLDELFVRDDNNSKKVDFVVKLPNCRHVFHEGCVRDWLFKTLTCPLCRQHCLPRLQGIM